MNFNKEIILLTDKQVLAFMSSPFVFIGCQITEGEKKS